MYILIKPSIDEIDIEVDNEVPTDRKLKGNTAGR